jgi:phosphate-selective porin OprO and OprP
MGPLLELLLIVTGLLWANTDVKSATQAPANFEAQSEPPTQANTEAQSKPPTLASAELGDASPFTPVTFGDGIEFYLPRSRFRMNLRFRMQNLADFNLMDNSPPNASAHEFDWAVRRLRMRMNGTVISPRLQYLLQLSFSRDDQNWDESQVPNVIRDAMIMYQVSDRWQLAFGQGKLPGNRQRVVSSGDQQFVDRSLVNQYFNIDRDFGFQARWSKQWREDVLRWNVAITSGMGRNRSVPADHRLFYTTRLEWLPNGEFSQNGDYFESDLAFEQKLKMSFAITSAFLDGAARNNGTVGPYFFLPPPENDQLARKSPWVHYADALFKWRGTSLYLEWVTRQLSQPQVSPQQAFLVGQGFNVQLGKMVSQNIELTARHSAILPQQSVEDLYPRLRQWVVGTNYFLNGHRVKLQANMGRTEGIDHFIRLQMELGI